MSNNNFRKSYRFCLTTCPLWKRFSHTGNHKLWEIAGNWPVLQTVDKRFICLCNYCRT
ncbi:hypothetical protein Bca4012_031062 [Brassica carinata]